jgi:DNA repair exonuclease SbcCD nuclease subunit
MKIALLNDTHAGARNSSDVFLDYFGRFYGEVFFPYCEKHGIKQILHLGDFYDHRKFINFKALHHNRKTFLEPMRKLGMTMDIIPGNHDVVYKNTNDLCSLKELLGFFVKDVNIVMKPSVIDYDGCRIALLPWINPENYEESMKFVASCDAGILGSHLELSGFDLLPGMPATHGMSPKDFSRFEMVWSGHYHTKQSRDNIHYLGTQFEMTWSDCNDPKYFHVFDTETREITAVPNPLTLFAKFVYDDTDPACPEGIDVSTFKDKFVKIVVKIKRDPFKFDRFVDRIQKVGVHEIKIAETFDEFSGSNVDDIDVESVSDTGDLLNAYVDSVETDLSKDTIKSKLRELYVEAQNLETV